MKRDAVVCIAAGKSQLALLDRCRSGGLAVIAVDRDPAAPGMLRADVAVTLSTHEAEPIVAALRELEDRFCIRGVISKSSGPPVLTCAKVARELGLLGLDPDFAARSIDKTGYAELCKEHGVPAPDAETWSAFDPARRPRFAAPWIVKPTLSAVGKRGVALVRQGAEFASAFHAASRSSADGRVEVQEFVEGRDVSVAAFFHRGVVLPLVLFDEHVSFEAGAEGSAALGRGFAMPSEFAGTATEKALFELSRRLLGSAGTGFGLLSFRVRPNGEALAIEAHLDLAGDFVTDRLFGASTSFDPIQASLALAIDGRLPLRLPSFAPVAVRFLYADELREVGAEDALLQMPGVSAVRGDLQPVGDLLGGRVGFAMVDAKDARELRNRVAAIDAWLGRTLERAQ